MMLSELISVILALFLFSTAVGMSPSVLNKIYFRIYFTSL